MPCKCSLRKRLLESNSKVSKADTYLDYCSTTKPDLEVLREVEKVFRIFWGNPSSQSTAGVNVYRAIINKSQKLLKLLDLESSHIYFDSSSSTIIKKINKQLKKEIITTVIEHKSLLENSHLHLPVDNNGQLNIDELKKNISSNTIFIYSPVNHETGTIQDIETIYKKCKSANCLVILDCVQTISRLHQYNWKPFCDGFYFSGHKIHSIPGAATLITNKEFKDLKVNDTLPFSLYEGTINSAGIIGLLTATENLIINFSKELQILKALHNDAINIIKKLKTPFKIESNKNSAPGIINISFPKLKNIEELLLFLNNNNIYVSRFSACSGNITDNSYVLKEMNREIVSTTTSIRISFGKYSKRGDFFKLIDSINSFFRLK